VPELSQLSGRLDHARDAIARCAQRTVDRDAAQLARAAQRLRAAPRTVLERRGDQLERGRERLRRAPALAIERKRAALETSAARLRVLSPQKTLERGYAIVRTDAGLVTTRAAIATGDRVDVRLADGSFGARVEDVDRQ
jgi:exodeoxyribonuclease VII large subunit